MGKGRIIEGTWDCSHCGNKKILARYKNCPSCGAPQGKDTNFKMPDKITYVPKEEADKISRNPDWLCSFCEQLNKDTDSTCKGCGASKQDSEKNYFKVKAEREAKEREIRLKEKELLENNFFNKDEDEFYEPNKIFEETENKNTFDDVKDEYDFTNSQKNPYIKKKNNFKDFLGNIDFISVGKILSISLLIILFITGLIYLFTPKDDILNVTELSWERSISIQKEKTVQESDWSIPAGGRLQYTTEEIHHYNQVLDHYETITEQKSRQVISGYEDVVTGYRDLGNGYFEEITSSQPVYTTEYYTETHQEPVYRDEPVYQTKYHYEIERWFYERSVNTFGKDKEPYWGEVILGNKEREGTRSEKYSIKAFNSKEEEKTYTVDYKTWKNINVSDRLNVKVYFGGKIEVVDENGEVIQFE